MKVVVVGSGGREHALTLAIKKSKQVTGVWAWPGSDGIFQDAESVPVEKQNYRDFCEWCVSQKIDLVVIGPEMDLVAGLSDQLRAGGMKVMGPSQIAAQLEGSKIFSKNFMREFGVPTARADIVKSVSETLEKAKKYSAPYVLKADGLAAGKGVFICSGLHELELSARSIFEEKSLGAAGEQALLEEFQPGEELSVLILTNGDGFEWLPICRDHKRLLDDDRGPNTGGMGVVGPVEINNSLKSEIEQKIIRPSLQGLQKRDYLFRGVLFIGIMVTQQGPLVIEYNVRFGDPETQVIMTLLDGDWAECLSQLAQGQLLPLKWHAQSTACIVLAAEGYPEKPKAGVTIRFENENNLAQTQNARRPQILHAGTRLVGDHFVTNGGRVLNVVATGKTLPAALQTAYQAVQMINWPGMQFRKDIGNSLV